MRPTCEGGWIYGTDYAACFFNMYSILTVHTDAGYTHWTLLYENKYYDSEFGLIESEYTHGKITSFLEIYTDE